MSIASSSTTSNCTLGDKTHMKGFITAAHEYYKTKSEETANILSRKLQLLGVSLEAGVFDPESSVVAEFFVSLHELMRGLDSRSPLMWYGAGVLQQACRNTAAQKALINTYQFLPILSKLLGDHLTRDKKRKLLCLMQELTYGINISWQISFLPQLLATLTRWIQSGEEGITALALGVLLNLCHKNLPVIYTLMRTINTKHFLRNVLALKNPSTEIQVSKLLIILEHTNGKVPQEDILNFVTITFRSIVEAYECKDLMRLRHIVEFFLEVQKQANHVDAVSMYENYHDDVQRILDAIEKNLSASTTSVTSQMGDPLDLECMSLLFDFFRALIDLKISSVQPLYPRIVTLALSWIQTETISSRALSLLSSALLQNVDTVREPIQHGSTVLIHILDTTPVADETTTISSDSARKITALLHLLRSLVSLQDRAGPKNKLVTALEVQNTALKLFDPLLSSTDQTALTSDLVDMFLYAVGLVCELGNHSDQYRDGLKQLLSQKPVQAVLARAFFASKVGNKSLIFQISRVHGFPVKEVAQIMDEIQGHQDSGDKQQGQQMYQMFGDGSLFAPIMSGAQIEQIDQLIQRLKHASASNQLMNVATSEVMELYEYKLASLGHGERVAQASLEAAAQHAVHLQHRVAQCSAELSRLHQLLYHTQQQQEQAERALKSSQEQMQTASARLTKEQVRNKELNRNIAEKEQTIKSNLEKIQTLESDLNETVQNNTYLGKKYEDQVAKNIALVKASAMIEARSKDLEKDLKEKTTKLAECKQQVNTGLAQIRELEDLRKQHETVIANREKELAEIHKELSERKKILETITRLTTSKVQSN